MSASSAQNLTPPAFNSETALPFFQHFVNTPQNFLVNNPVVYTSGTLSAGTWAFFYSTCLQPNGGQATYFDNILYVVGAGNTIAEQNISYSGLTGLIDQQQPLGSQGNYTSSVPFQVEVQVSAQNEPPTPNPTGSTLITISVVGIKLA
jgi:hypothetical protein|nr:MAG: hypothetical protein [Lake Baikal virophage 10]